MKKFNHFKIGGIQIKVFILNLMTVLLLAAAFVGMSLYLGDKLGKMFNEFSKNEQAVVGETTGEVMDQLIRQDLRRVNRTEANFLDKMLKESKSCVIHMADCLKDLFANPDAYGSKPYDIVDLKDDGIWKTKVVYASDTDRNNPVLRRKLGLLANLSNTMVSTCRSYGVQDLYIGLPEGALFSASNFTASWFDENGNLLDYHPDSRVWYKEAAQKGLIFTDGEWDFSTGKYCVECAAPVYDPEGKLQAVIGLDLFLDEIVQVLQDASVEGECCLLINQDGKAILPMQAKEFPMPSEDMDKDLRKSGNTFLSQTVENTLNGKETEVSLAQLNGENYYIVATPIPTTGWMLLSAYRQAVADQSAVLLNDRLSTVQNDEMMVYRDNLNQSQLAFIVLMIAVALLTFGVAVAVGRHIVKPLNIISRRISELNEENLEFRMEDDYRTGDEVENLAESFAAISHKTMEYMDKVVKVTAEKERIGTELALATQIQAGMLPHTFPCFPDRDEFDIYASMNPAKEVGGDFYDFFLIDDDHLALVIADVSGKGVPAALYMMASMIMISDNAMMNKDPAQVLIDANRALCNSGQEDMFVTVWIGILEVSTGTLIAANGGHEYPALMRDGQFELYKDVHGLLVGGIPEMTYKNYELQLKPGDKIFVYTDGIPEAHNRANKMFGTERMISVLNQDPKAAPETLLQNMSKAVEEYMQGAEQFDDLTMLCIEYKGKTGKEAEPS